MNGLLKSYFNFIKKFIPNKAEGTAVGIDIGSSDCKLVEIQRIDDSFELKSCRTQPIVDGDVKSAVQGILSTLETPCIAPYTSVSGKGTLIRHIEMPRMALNELKNSFEIEADKYFPFAQDQIYTDCYILNPSSKGKHMDVMAAASKKEIIDERVSLLTDIGVQPSFIGINAIALANVFNVLSLNLQEESDGAIAILDMGETVSNLTISIKNLPRFNRDIYTGGRDITKRISNAMGVSFQEAEQLKREPENKANEVLAASETAIENIVQELKLSFDYFATERDIEISKLYLTGGGSMMNGIIEVFEKNLEIKVLAWDPLATIKKPSEEAKSLDEESDKKRII